ncbi:type IX secretion system membrane protein PorP/SprF [Pontibacter sp. HSC-36F09]|uniref:PorP/SprF family type IX secretion system membrane protein n=1 Tax=Pontibacter sp. HSC-36F09 TaxID=2910966 RepID=UPI00209C811B|nr:type IX secretion system membrane protein PorP/SprF [Pontibacter sp. HSC-36F09]MCP2042026.1 type IX secretion system PorP/SprF family membrane protein [Pontibacter sp. HSC-36F09]
MKNNILILCFLLIAFTASAQQKALYSQYMTNYFILNPAVAGFEKDVSIKMGYRNQWVGFEGAPKTFYVSGEGALFNKHLKRSRKAQGFHGAGGMVYTDQTGPTTRTGALASYAYHVPLNRKIFLSSGFSAGFQQFRFDPAKVRLADGSNERDPVTNHGRVDAFMPDLTLGTFMHSEDFYFGVSLFQVLGNKIHEVDGGEEVSRLSRHLFVSGGYNFDVHDKIRLMPSALLKYVQGAPIQADFNVKAAYHMSKRRQKTVYDDQVWAGISYRTQDAIVGLVGVQFQEQFQLSYTYDITVSPVRHHSAGSHEIVLGYRFK